MSKPDEIAKADNERVRQNIAALQTEYKAMLDSYPEDHSPFCPKRCDHPCHDAYDEEHA